MTKRTAHMLVWENCFGAVATAKDAFGDQIDFHKFNKKGKGGWYIDIILWPENMENSAEKDKYINFSNLQPLSLKNAIAKYNKQSGIINGKKFKVINRITTKYVGIMLVDGMEAYLYDRWQ